MQVTINQSPPAANLPQVLFVRIIRVRHSDGHIGVFAMMGHLVFGRYGHDGASPLRAGKGWIERIWRSMFAHKPLAPH